MTAAKPRTARPMIEVRHPPLMTVVRFAVKPAPVVRARLLAAGFAWSYARRFWTALDEYTDAQVYVIINGTRADAPETEEKQETEETAQ